MLNKKKMRKNSKMKTTDSTCFLCKQDSEQLTFFSFTYRWDRWATFFAVWSRVLRGSASGGPGGSAECPESLCPSPGWTGRSAIVSLLGNPRKSRGFLRFASGGLSSSLFTYLLVKIFWNVQSFESWKLFILFHYYNYSSDWNHDLFKIQKNVKI